MAQDGTHGSPAQAESAHGTWSKGDRLRMKERGETEAQWNERRARAVAWFAAFRADPIGTIAKMRGGLLKCAIAGGVLFK